MGRKRIEPVRPVLAGVDFSDCCVLVVGRAIDEALASGATHVWLVHAAELPEPFGDIDQNADADRPEPRVVAAREALEQNARLFMPFYEDQVSGFGLASVVRILEGSTEAVLAAQARDSNAAMVVLGRRRSGQAGLHARLSERLGVSVLTVRTVHDGEHCEAPSCQVCDSGVDTLRRGLSVETSLRPG